MRCVLLSFFLVSSAWAGSWGSSGSGEFMRDQHNPWFVKGMTEVRYCLEMDQQGISASPDKIRSLSEKAINYWKDEFTSHNNVIEVGTQTFTLTNNFPAEKCKGDEDLKIQFGYGTLSPDQLKEFQDHDENPQNYVGIAIRTAYDKVTLRGKGFVFISSDRGSHSYNSGNGISKDLWNHDGLLFRVLQHEMGHVFGVAHTDNGFMAADFPENMVRNFRPFRTIKVQSFFSPRDSVSSCATENSLPIKDALCVHLRTPDRWKSLEAFAETLTGAEIRIGKSTSVQRTSTRQQFPVKLFLPEEQKIFSHLPGELVLRGPARQQFKLLVDFVEEGTNNKTKLLLDIGPSEIEAYSVKDGEMKRWF